ncbi:hypothetical protein QGM71_13440 [Virgibacillus sp. C22-A2]|uniref:Lipoprotein n=1 Tax=Virgibacillus tibetensis TaxID=3042313 RepID=A0ABU6KGR5_9BACI|nr:hypothetical protein [Virgibacillus sp. C22-A2]
MKRKILLRLGASVLAISLVAACGTDPVEEDAPLDQQQQDQGNNQNNGNGMNEGDDGILQDENEMDGGQGNQ